MLAKLSTRRFRAGLEPVGSRVTQAVPPRQRLPLHLPALRGALEATITVTPAKEDAA
jgi:hypothetical protein